MQSNEESVNADSFWLSKKFSGEVKEFVGEFGGLNLPSCLRSLWEHFRGVNRKQGAEMIMDDQDQTSVFFCANSNLFYL